MTSIAAFIFVLGVMVLFHELGHFLAARYFGIRVESFSIGFGPRLFGFKRGDTDYKICALPLGGYVKMAGENFGEPSGDPNEFLAKPRWQRLVVVFMGPAFNGILAVGMLAGLYTFHYESYAFMSEPAVVGYIETDSGAARAGLEVGDEIVGLDGDPTPTWKSVRLVEIAAVHRDIDVVVMRNGERKRFNVPIQADHIGMGYGGWTEDARVRLFSTQPGMPAEKAGIVDNDTLVAINGERIRAVGQVVDTLQRLGGSEIELELEREGARVKTRLSPVFRKDEENGDAWRIGVGLRALHEPVITQLSFSEALTQSVDENVENATLIFRFLGGLFEQRMSAKSLTGPLGIAQLSGEAARQGPAALLRFMAIISLQLGIFNLLPIPILDGGVIVLLLLESAMRRDISMAIKERILQAGLVFLAILFAFVMYNDILKSLSSG
jgi:regulator of sigma E protease